MSLRVTLLRASRLVGVPRGVLQRMILAGELAEFDGLVALDDLERAFPQARFDDSGAFEQVARIKDEAFGRRVRERTLPSQEILAGRLFAQSQELADVRRHLERYHALVSATLERLQALGVQHPACGEIARALDGGLAAILGDESAAPMEAYSAMLKVVSAQVTIRPSGHEFVVEGNDSLLQAALKAGLRLGYGCGSGSCGLCKARVVSGEIRSVQHADYRLSAAEEQQGYALLCANTALSDVVIETLEASGPRDIPRQELVATVRAVEPLAADTLLLHLQTPRSSRLRFLAGQSVTLGISGAAGDAELTLPLASCPCDDRNLHFHVARDDHEAFRARLFGGQVRPGQPVNVRGPSGDFVLAGEAARPLLFIACDTGFAPLRSLVEHAIAIDDAESFAVHWHATRADGHYLDRQCRAWTAAFDNFRYRPTTGADPVAGGREVAGTAAGEHDLAARDVYVAGPKGFVEAAATALLSAGAQPAQLLTLVVD